MQWSEDLFPCVWGVEDKFKHNTCRPVNGYIVGTYRSGGKCSVYNYHFEKGVVRFEKNREKRDRVLYDNRHICVEYHNSACGCV